MQRIKTWIRENPHVWWTLVLPVYLTLFFIIEHFIKDNYWATQTSIDYHIPFIPQFIVIYDSWSFLLFALGIYLIVKDPEGFRRYMWTILLTFFTATAFCALVPNGQDLRLPPMLFLQPSNIGSNSLSSSTSEPMAGQPKAMAS